MRSIVVAVLAAVGILSQSAAPARADSQTIDDSGFTVSPFGQEVSGLITGLDSVSLLPNELYVDTVTFTDPIASDRTPAEIAQNGAWEICCTNYAVFTSKNNNQVFFDGVTSEDANGNLTGLFYSFRYTDQFGGDQPYIIPSEFFFDAIAVPEPGTWTMMMVGFCGVGAALRRRIRHQSAALLLA